MLVIIAILIAFLVPLLVLGLSFSRLRYGYSWLLIVGGALLSWILVISARSQLPIEITLVNWQIDLLSGESPAILVDRFSWPYAVAIITIALAAVLTDVAHIRDLDPQVWASTLALAGMGLLAVVAGNPLTLLLAWAAIDISESGVLLRRVNGSAERERVVISFSVQSAGMLFLFVSMLQAWSLGLPLTFLSIPPEVSGFLVLSAGLRLGVIPPHQPYLGTSYQRRGLGTMIRLVPVAATVVLLQRVAVNGAAGGWLAAMMVLAALGAIYGAVGWIRADDALQGRPYWILALGAFALGSAVQGWQSATAGWALALLFSGALLFLFSERQGALWLFSILGVAGFSALPFTPAWEGVSLLFEVAWVYRIVFWVSLALLLVGYLRHAQKIEPGGPNFERWMWIIYPLGLAFLPLTHFGVILQQWADGLRAISIQSPGWWSGLISLGLAGLLIFTSQRRMLTVPPILAKAGNIFALNWLYRIFWQGYRLLGRLVRLFSRLLEGDGGILWALLVLILLVVSLNLWGSGGGFEF